MSEVRTHRGRRIGEPEYQRLVAAALADHGKTLDRANGLLLALHAAGFRSVLLESTLIGDTNPGYAYCIIDEAEISPGRFETLARVAVETGAAIALAPLDVSGPSRLRLWPRDES